MKNRRDLLADKAEPIYKSTFKSRTKLLAPFFKIKISKKKSGEKVLAHLHEYDQWLTSIIVWL